LETIKKEEGGEIESAAPKNQSKSKKEVQTGSNPLNLKNRTQEEREKSPLDG